MNKPFHRLKATKPFACFTIIISLVFLIILFSLNSNPQTIRQQPMILSNQRKADDKLTTYKYLFGPARVPTVKEQTFTRRKKYFIYSCDGSGLCGGLADRLEGIVAGYLIAEMLGRTFGIKFTVPCELSKYLMPNVVNWTIDNEKLRGLPTKYEYVIDQQAWALRDRMVSMDFEASYKQDVVYFRVNQEFVQYLMKNQLFKSLKWTVGLTVPDIYNIVYRRLFLLTPKLEDRFRDFQTIARKDNKKLVCAQIRVWRNPTIPSDYEPKQRLDLKVVWNFLNSYNDSSKYSIFVSSDSEQVRKTGFRLYPEAVVDVEGSIVHVERSTGAQVCGGLGKVILDQLVLSTCDVLVLTNSGVGRIASFLRGSSEGLYCASIQKFEKCSPFDPGFIPKAW